MKAIILTCALLFGAGAASAQPAEQQMPVERVRVADLNLASSEGRARLDERLRAAANRVCEVGGSQDLWTFRFSRKCVESALANAKRQRDRIIVEFLPRESSSRAQ